MNWPPHPPLHTSCPFQPGWHSGCSWREGAQKRQWTGWGGGCWWAVGSRVHWLWPRLQIRYFGSRPVVSIQLLPASYLPPTCLSSAHTHDAPPPLVRKRLQLTDKIIHLYFICISCISLVSLVFHLYYGLVFDNKISLKKENPKVLSTTVEQAKRHLSLVFHVSWVQTLPKFDNVQIFKCVWRN